MKIRCLAHQILEWDDPNCSTCKSVQYHHSIYGHINDNKAALELYKKRVAKAFSSGRLKC